MIPACTLLLASMAAAGVLLVTQNPSQKLQTIAIFKPGQGIEQHYTTLAKHDIRIIRQGGLGFVLIVEGGTDDIRQKLKLAGAVISFPAPVLGGCFFWQDKNFESS